MLGLIWAQAANGVIGRDNTIPWHLPEDMAHFRRVTAGSTVLMGRRTWESLPARFRPLPGRHNVVLTHDESWTGEGATVVHDLSEALHGDRAVIGGDLAVIGADLWVIGGADLYAAALPVADIAEVTELRESFAGDVCAPALDGRWRIEARDPVDGWHESSTGLHYRWCRYRRAGASG